MGNARINYLINIHAAEDIYDGSYNTADGLYETQITAAGNGYDLSIANASSAYIDASGTASVNYQQGLVAPLTSDATSLADAATLFQTSNITARQARYTNLLQSDTSNFVQHGSYRTNLLADWMNGLSQAFTNFQSDLTQAEAARSHSIAASNADLSRDYASADVTYLNNSQTHAETFRSGEAPLGYSYDTQTTDAWQTWDVDYAVADRDLAVDRAEALKTRLIARATAEKTYQIAIAQAESIDGSDNTALLDQAEADKVANMADAEMNYKIDLADADLVWVNAIALADRLETHAWALANHSYDTGLAPLESAYLIGQTGADGTYENSLAAAESNQVSDYSLANTQFYTSQRSADANYITSDHAARVTGFNNLNTAASLPFTNAHHQIATAEQTAWLNIETNFNSTTTNVNSQTTTYDNLIAGQITGLATNSTGAKNTYIGTVAPAIQTRDVNHAGA